MLMPRSLLMVALMTSALSANEPPVQGLRIAIDDAAPNVESAKLRGAADAWRDILQRHTFRILYFGPQWPAGKALIDQVTGFRIEIVTYSAVSSTFAEEVNGYNDVMRFWYEHNK